MTLYPSSLRAYLSTFPSCVSWLVDFPQRDPPRRGKNEHTEWIPVCATSIVVFRQVYRKRPSANSILKEEIIHSCIASDQIPPGKVALPYG